MADLALIPTEELIAEICSRFDSTIIAAAKIETTTRSTQMMHWNGNWLTTLGLLDYATDVIKADIHGSQRTTKEHGG